MTNNEIKYNIELKIKIHSNGLKRACKISVRYRVAARNYYFVFRCLAILPSHNLHIKFY